jgi:cell division protein ZapA (FtsZ GTPase activity inhibitor)
LAISTPISIHFEILGRPLTLKSDSSAEQLERVQLVEEKIRETRKALPKAANEEIAIMTALNIAFDYLEMKEDLHHLRQEIESKSKNLIQLIENRSSLPLR